MDDSSFTEISGVAASRNNPGVLFIHNDGARDKVFAIRTDGALQATFDLGASVEDFEDIAVGPGPVEGVSYIYAGDIGDNSENRNSISIYWVAEPEVSTVPTKDPPSKSFKNVVQVKLKYPDGAHNAEALLADPVTGDLFIVTKQTSNARVYRVGRSDLESTKTVTLDLVVEVAMDHVSGGDISPDGSEIVLRREDAAFLWRREPGQSVAEAFQNAAVSIPVIGPPTEPNGEGIAFSPNGDGYFTVSEGKNQPVYFFPRLATPPASFAGVSHSSSDGLELTINGTAGTTIAIEASSDLIHWSEIGSVFMSDSSTTFVDRSSMPERIYRLRE